MKTLTASRPTSRRAKTSARRATLDPEKDTPALKALLFEGVRAKFTPYSKAEMQGILDKLRDE